MLTAHAERGSYKGTFRFWGYQLYISVKETKSFICMTGNIKCSWVENIHFNVIKCMLYLN